jgi:hypothetical protein
MRRGLLVQIHSELLDFYDLSSQKIKCSGKLPSSLVATGEVARDMLV